MGASSAARDRRTTGCGADGFYLGNENGVHVAFQNEIYDSYRGCVCLLIRDFAVLRADPPKHTAAPDLSASFKLDLSVTGIAIQSSYQDARLESEGYKITKIGFAWPGETAASAVRKTAEGQDTYLLQGIDGKVVRIHDTLDFSLKSVAGSEETVRSLREKFGRATSESFPQSKGSSFNVDWNYDHANRVRTRNPLFVTETAYSLPRQLPG